MGTYGLVFISDVHVYAPEPSAGVGGEGIQVKH